MPQYLKDYGERLVALGYTVLPIKPGTKRPDLKNWPQHATTAADVVAWYSNGRAQHGAGINARDTPAIDVDVMDQEVADAMSEAIDAIFPGVSLMTRTGLAPKFLIPFRSDEPFRKLSSNVYTDGEHEHKVEILGDGQQWVAYHVHPETQRPYAWFDGLGDGGIADLEHDALPFLDRTNAQRVIDAFEILAARKVASGTWSVKSVHKSDERVRPISDDPFIEHGADPLGKTDSEVSALLKRHPNNEADYDHWFAVLAAVHHELGDAGRDAAYEWSSSSSKHTDEKFDTTWNSLGRYSGRQITLRSLLKNEERPKSGAQPDISRPWQVFPDDEFSFDFHTEWLIDDVLPQADLAVIYGASGSGKTFFVLDMVASVARGVQWRSNETKQAGVVYISAEGAGGFRTRVAAYRKHHDIEGPLFGVMPAAPNLLFEDDVSGVVNEIQQFGVVGLVVIDTLAATMPGGEENSGKDMGRAIAHCKQIAQRTGAMVVLVHHSGKDEAKGARGWSGLRAAADVEIEITRDEDMRGARVTKQKDGEDNIPFPFRLQVVPLGFRATGKEITSCVVVVDQEEMPGKVKPRAGGAVQRLVSDVYSDKAPLSGEGLTVEELVSEVLTADPTKRGANIRRAISDMLKRDFFVMKADKLVYF